ncbi:MAG: hypothetical protein ACKO6N_06205 [Myxococcota bacterium]
MSSLHPTPAPTDLSHWQARVSQGRHTAWLQPSIPRLLHPDALLLTVVCHHSQPPLSPLIEARERVESLLDATTPLLDLAAERVKSGLRRRLLGDEHPVLSDAGLSEALQRLARQTSRPCVLVFEGLEQADTGTLEVLRSLVTRPGACPVALGLVFRHGALSAEAQRLVDALASHEGPDAILGRPSPEDHTSAETDTGIDSTPPLASLEAAGLPVKPEATTDAPQPKEHAPLTLERVTPPTSMETPELPAASSHSLPEPATAEVTRHEPVVLTTRIPVLPSAVLRVLRAAALIGERFEVSLVASLLELPPLTVLELLQEAYDAGVALEDLGEGRLVLSPSWVERLQQGLLPSLKIAWHRRLGTLLSPPIPAVSEVPVSEPKPSAHSPAAPVVPAAQTTAAEHIAAEHIAAEHIADAELVSTSDAPSQVASTDDTLAEASTPTPAIAEGDTSEADRVESVTSVPWSSAEFTTDSSSASSYHADTLHTATATEATAQPSLTDAERLRQEAIAQEIEATRRARERDTTTSRTHAPRRPITSPFIRPGSAAVAEPPSPPRREPARAADHFSASGELDKAAESYLNAAEQAARMGAQLQAIPYVQQALTLLDRLPQSESRRILRIRALLDLGRYGWEVAGQGRQFSLKGVTERLEQALHLLHPNDPPVLRAEVHALLASVCYDLGDRPALDRALDELTQASRILQEAGDPAGAARYLNDQAAVWVRLGDPVRAHYLLTESRKVFESRASSDKIAAEELAETDHLLARLTFHVPARPGRERDAIQVGLKHAQAAERTYQQLKNNRELARVWETLARLEILNQQEEQALERLQQTLRVQQQLRDVLGLARTAGVLAELLARRGDARQALGLLGESIALNAEKGSIQGLTVNQQGLETIQKMLQQHVQEGRLPARVWHTLQELLRRLSLQLKQTQELLSPRG